MPTTHTFIDLKDKTLANAILPWYKNTIGGAAWCLYIYKVSQIGAWNGRELDGRNRPFNAIDKYPGQDSLHIKAQLLDKLS